MQSHSHGRSWYYSGQKDKPGLVDNGRGIFRLNVYQLLGDTTNIILQHVNLFLNSVRFRHRNV